MQTPSAMSETVTISKSDAASPCALTSDKNDWCQRPERNFTRYVCRKFQDSQLPIRCQRPSPYRRPLARSPFKFPGLFAVNRISSNCINSYPDSLPCTPIFRSTRTNLYKKSLSMIDLSAGNYDPEINDLSGSSSTSTLARHEEIGERAKEILGNISSTNFPTADECGIQSLETSFKAANLVCHALVLNAWRRRRDEIGKLHETIDQLGQQVEHLHIQIIVLRRLLENENSRVGKLANEAHRAKAQIEEIVHEKDVLATEKEKLEDELKRVTEVSEEQSVAIQNLKNELNSAQCQLDALDSQISRDREKLLKLREDKRILLDKVSASDALAAERGARADRAETVAEDLQIRLAAQIALVDASQQQTQLCSKELKAREEEKLALEKRLRSSEEAAKALSLRAASLESQLADREAALHRIESLYNSQMSELNDLKERLVRQSQESGWSSRMLQIAGSVVRAPRAILRTLSFLSSTAVTSPP